MKTKNKKMWKKKLKSTLFWSGIASALIIFVQNFLLMFGYHLSAETVSHIIICINSLFSLLTIVGVLVDTGEVDSFQTMVMKIKQR